MTNIRVYTTIYLIEVIKVRTLAKKLALELDNCFAPAASHHLVAVQGPAVAHFVVPPVVLHLDIGTPRVVDDLSASRVPIGTTH